MKDAQWFETFFGGCIQTKTLSEIKPLLLSDILIEMFVSNMIFGGFDVVSRRVSDKSKARRGAFAKCWHHVAW